jgi:hypothetical protein
VLARYSLSRFIGVFTDARGGLIMVYKVGSRFITVYRSVEQAGASPTYL